jgi:riboflavin synthase alpha subunit
VQVIPYTFDHTNVKGLRTGDRVNLECDMLGKYVVRAAELAGLTRTTARVDDAESREPRAESGELKVK